MTNFGFIFIIAMIVAGLWMIRSARRSNRSIWGQTVCRSGGCRFRNRPEAKFCARCGRPLNEA